MPLVSQKVLQLRSHTKTHSSAYVKPYVKSHKNDFIDADAIAEAASRPHMRFVTPKSEIAQVLIVIRRVRTAYIKDRTACINRISPMLLEFGISLPKGYHQMKNVFQRIMGHDELLPPLLLLEVKQHFDYYELLNTRVKEQEEKLQRIMRQQGTAIACFHVFEDNLARLSS